jgi:low temperature requirement protein LtrA
MFKKGIIRSPRLRGRAGEERERHATWLELFYDLVFVAAVSQLAGNLIKNYSLTGLLHFAILFVTVWWAWVGQTFYLTRFDSDDVGHRLIIMIQIVAVASLIVHLTAALGKSSGGFALSYAAVRCILIAEYFRAGSHIPHVRPLINHCMIGFGSPAALWAVSTLIPLPHRFFLWYVAIAVDFLAPLTAGQLHARFSPHLMHLPERFGLFTIIVIGEAVVGVVMRIGADRLTLVAGAAGVMGLIIAINLWWEYFEGVRGAGTRQLTSKNHVRAYQQWHYSHLPLTMGIASVADAVKRVIVLAPHQLMHVHEAWIFCTSAGACIF